MSKAMLGGFALVVAMAAGSVDYVNQARHAGSKPGAFGISAYAATITGRFGDHQAALDAERVRNDLLAMPSKNFLPEPPEGWTRSDWNEAAAAQLRAEHSSDALSNADAEVMSQAMAADPTMTALTTMGKAALAQRDEAQVYVYEKPGAIIAMRVAKQAKSAGFGPQGFAMQMVANNIEAMSGKEGYAVVKGVTYRLERGLFGVADQEREYRVITAMVGDEVKISVRARAEDTDIISLLEGVDYDRLNQMLEHPVAGIGSAAPVLTAEESLALANANVATAAAAQRAEAAEQERRLQLASLDLLFRHGKMTQADYDAAKAKLENAHSEAGFIAGIAAASEKSNALASTSTTPGDALAQLQKAQAALEAATPNGQASIDATPVAPGAGTASGGGLLGMLGGFFGAKTGSDPAENASAKTAPSVSFGGFGGNCKVVNGVKRCSLGGN